MHYQDYFLMHALFEGGGLDDQVDHTCIKGSDHEFVEAGGEAL